MHERRAPRVADDLRAEDDVAELPRHAVRQLVAAVDREREHVRRLVDAEVLPLERPDLVGPDERDAELAPVDALGGEHASARARPRPPASTSTPLRFVDLDRHHGTTCAARCRSPRRAACTPRRCAARACAARRPRGRSGRTRSRRSRRGCRCTWISPDACSRGRSICVTSPVTTTFDPNPSRVRNICICSGLVFCASSRMMKESLSVRPRMNASGATSIVPRSMYAASRSGSSMS